MKSLLFPARAEWLDALTRDFIQLVETTLTTRDVVHVALSGGTTPRAFYQRLAMENLPWSKIEWWLGDERRVPSGDSACNARMIRESLGVGRSPKTFRFHAWETAREADDAARHYADLLRERGGDPLDLALLGLGADGHTASLFPGDPALEEKIRATAPSRAPSPPVERLTLTFPALDRARQVWFLVQGRSKSDMAKRLLRADPLIPAAHIRAPDQRLYWLQD